MVCAANEGGWLSNSFQLTLTLQMVNHGVATEIMQGMKDAADKFFELPLEEKNKLATPSDYTQGYGHFPVLSEEQILDWSDRLGLLICPHRNRKLEVWPPTPFK